MNIVFADVYHFHKKIMKFGLRWIFRLVVQASSCGWGTLRMLCYVTLQCIPGWNTFAQRCNWTALSVMSFACYKT